MTTPVSERLSKTFAFFAAAIGLAFIGVSFANNAHAAVEKQQLKSVTGGELKSILSKNSAKATVVNFWATWCPPCKEEMPELIEVKNAFAAQGVKLVLVSADSSDDLPEATKFLRKVGAELPSFHLGEEPEEFVKSFDPNWPATLPATFIFDGGGKRQASWIGRVTRAKLEEEIRRVLTQGTVATPGKIKSDGKSRSKK
jgi:thiol-disulfide isomerase/thioredoxin